MTQTQMYWFLSENWCCIKKKSWKTRRNVTILSPFYLNKPRIDRSQHNQILSCLKWEENKLSGFWVWSFVKHVLASMNYLPKLTDHQYKFSRRFDNNFLLSLGKKWCCWQTELNIFEFFLRRFHWIKHIQKYSKIQKHSEMFNVSVSYIDWSYWKHFNMFEYIQKWSKWQNI